MSADVRGVITWLKNWFYDENEIDAKEQALQNSISNKVDKVTGKGLSTNDYTTTEKNKLANIQAQANKTIVDSALDNSSTNPVENQAIANAFENIRIKVVDSLPNPPSSEYSDDVYISLNNWTGGLYVCRYVSHENGELLGYGEWEWVQLDRGLSFSDVYPVGSIYMSVNSTSPSTLFGGTWQRLEDTFLYATSGTADTGYQATDGEATHTLTASESGQKNLGTVTSTGGNHYHTLDSNYRYLVNTADGSGVSRISTAGQTGTKVSNLLQSPNPVNRHVGVASGNLSVSTTIGGSDASSAHNNMPPYMKVYMWKRTA